MKVLERIEDCLQTVGVNWRFPVWLCPRQRHNRCNLCSQASASISSYQQETLHGFCRPGEGFWCSASKGHQVGAEKTWCGLCDWCRGCMSISRAMSMLMRVQWRVWSEGWCSARLGTQPSALHHCAWSLATQVQLLGPLGGPLYQWTCYHRWIARGMCQEALDLERSSGGERTE